MWFLPKWLQRNKDEPQSRMVAPPPALSVPLPPPPRAPGRRAGRPIASSLSRTIQELQTNPNITATDLSQLLSVTQSYARTLLRRARGRSVHGQTAPASCYQPVAAALIRTPVGSRRAATLKLAEAGHSAEFIADKLQTTPGEVEFTLKVQRLLTA